MGVGKDTTKAKQIAQSGENGVEWIVRYIWDRTEIIIIKRGRDDEIGWNECGILCQELRLPWQKRAGKGVFCI